MSSYKKNFVFSVLMLLIMIPLSTVAQDDKFHEVRINIFDMTLKTVTIDYERNLQRQASFGVNMLISLQTAEERFNSGTGYLQRLALTSYYRVYFGNKIASGFFMEGFSMLNRSSTQTSPLFGPREVKEFNALSIGMGIGSKFILGNNMVGEVMIGMGRQILISKDLDQYELTPRIAVSLGKRF